MKKFYTTVYSFAALTAISACVLGVPSVQATEELTVEVVLSFDADPDYGEYLAGECMTCHGGQATNIPGIKGKEPAYIAGALIEYKNLTRENETMRSFASAMGIEEIAALSAYFSVLE